MQASVTDSPYFRLGEVLPDRLVAGVEVTLQHQTPQSSNAVDNLGCTVLGPPALQGVVLVGVAVAAIHGNVEWQLGSRQFLFGYGNESPT